MPATHTASERVDVHILESGTVVTIRGTLDQAAGDALIQATAGAVGQGATRLEIDLCSLDGFTDAFGGKPVDNKEYAKARGQLMAQIRERQQQAMEKFKAEQMKNLPPPPAGANAAAAPPAAKK